jgi:hypothetical protein
MQRHSGSFVLFLAAFIVLICSVRADAIPAFTRQHKAECTTCHTIFPELNEYGEAFRKNGYVYMGKKKAEPAESAKAAGTEKKASGQESAKNEALWLSAIPELVPVSFTASIDLAYNDQAADNDKFDLSTRALTLEAGGSFRDKAGFYFTYNLYNQGNYDPLISNTPVNNRSDIGELFIFGRQLFGTPINVKVGRLQPQLSLWKSSDRLTSSVPGPQNYKVGYSPFALNSTEDAAEINAILGSRVFLAGGVVNRKGQNQKEGYGHVSFRIGGADFHAEEPEMDLENERILDYLTVTIAGYGYYGRDADLFNGIAFNRNDFWRAGGDLDAIYKRFRLKAMGVTGRDSNPYFLATKMELRSMALSTQLDYMFDTNLIALFRYEYVDDGSGSTNRYIPAIVYAPLQNTRFTLEYRHEVVGGSALRFPATNKIALLGVMFSL